MRIDTAFVPTSKAAGFGASRRTDVLRRHAGASRTTPDLTAKRAAEGDANQEQRKYLASHGVLFSVILALIEY